MNGLFEGRTGQQIRTAVMVAVWLLVAFLAVETVLGLLSFSYVGQGVTPTNTVTVSGEGHAYAIPDTAEFTYSVVSDKPTVAEAQSDATTIANAVTSYLESAGVSAQDVQTTGYSISPQYQYQNAACPVSSGTTPLYCPPGRQILIGYEVQQTNDVKVHSLSSAGDLLTGIGSKGATEVSGLSFTVSDPTTVDEQARDQAVAQAKASAAELAQSLGVSLGHIVSFTETNGQPPGPMYAMAASAGNVAASAPTISPGQNEVTSDVSITYEIR
ncbi:MAG: SIMPL domain-containing protein [Patescibacteria group bacterium]|nr:SIMPL domain-containing protein [Patescibacteria group bacterium]